MADRKRPTSEVEADVLLASRRRCCICYGLHRDLSVKQGQLAHLSRDPSDSSADNLAFMCLEHHDWYDTKTSQSKGPAVEEARHYRAALYDELRRGDEADARLTTVPQLVAGPNTIEFQKIDVFDDRLQLQWIIRRPPERWLGKYDVAKDLRPLSVSQILDGPFHAVPNCHERLAELPVWHSSSNPSPPLAENCPGCGEQIFTAAYVSLEKVRVLVWPVRAQALAEIDRMHRLGREIKGPRLVLENPQYWKAMLPPPHRGAG